MKNRKTQNQSSTSSTPRGSALVVSMCIAMLAGGLVGCRSAPMLQPDALRNPGTASGNAARIESAIVTGARRAGWNTEAGNPIARTIDARYMVRPQVFVIVRIDYRGGQISFRYSDSSGFRCDPVPDGCSSIHKTYNKRLLRLRGQIEQALAEPAATPIGVPHAVSIIRQVIEEQPRRSAYTVVDVTVERVSAIREVVTPVYYPSAYYGGWADDWWFRSNYGYGQHGFYYGPNYGPYYGWNFLDTAFVSTPYADVVYFNNIGRIEWRDAGRWRVIQIWDRHGDSRMRLFVLDEWLAKRFIDAVGVLVQARLAAEEIHLPPMGRPPE